MRLRVFLVGLVAVVFVVMGTVPALTQEPQEDVRGAFLTTRPKSAEKSSKSTDSPRPPRRRPKTVTAKATVSVSAGSTAAPNDPPGKATAQKLGLGLTLYTRDSMGLAVRADPARTFHRGDRVRILLETNTDGHLYIFNTTNGGTPVLIYPNSELDEGGNYIRSHIPFEIPSGSATEERLRWLVFDEYAGTERLYFVFTRDPLPGIPLEDELLAYCGNAKNKCPIKPDAQLWVKIEKDVDAPLQIAATAKFGKAQTGQEHDAVERGLGLSKEEPEPSVILMSASANTAILVTMLDLVHK